MTFHPRSTGVAVSIVATTLLAIVVAYLLLHSGDESLSGLGGAGKGVIVMGIEDDDRLVGAAVALSEDEKVTLETDAAKARALGRKELARYMVLPNYRNNWLRDGFTESDLADGGSDRFIDAMMLWGDADTVKKGLRAHFAAGATHVCLQPVHADGDFAQRDRILSALADT